MFTCSLEQLLYYSPRFSGILQWIDNSVSVGRADSLRATLGNIMNAPRQSLHIIRSISHRQLRPEDLPAPTSQLLSHLLVLLLLLSDRNIAPLIRLIQ